MEDTAVGDVKKSKNRKSIYPYAFFSLILGILSFIQLMGLERALAAVVFGVIALAGINKDKNLKGRKYAYWGIGLGILYLIILLIIIVYKRGELLWLLKNK